MTAIEYSNPEFWLPLTAVSTMAATSILGVISTRLASRNQEKRMEYNKKERLREAYAGMDSFYQEVYGMTLREAHQRQDEMIERKTTSYTYQDFDALFAEIHGKSLEEVGRELGYV
jgi:hypothetical protein